LLVISFTRALAAKLRNLLQTENGEIHKNIEILHFHEWCKIKADEANILPPYDSQQSTPRWKILEQTAIHGVQQGFIPKEQYGAVLIDEGHDFEADWLRLLAQMVDKKTQSLLFIYDSAQSIYKGRHTKLKFPSLASVGIKAQGRTTVLKKNYRNSSEITEFSKALIAGHQNGEDNLELPPIGTPETAGFVSGIKPAVQKFASLDEEIITIIRYLQAWHARGTRWNAMSVIYPGGMAGENMAEALAQAHIPFHHLRDMDSKSAYKPQQNVLPLLTIHSCKGLEFPAVAVLDSSFTPADREADVSLSMRLLYVAATRAREALLMTFHRHNAVSRALQQAAAQSTP